MQSAVCYKARAAMLASISRRPVSCICIGSTFPSVLPLHIRLQSLRLPARMHAGEAAASPVEITVFTKSASEVQGVLNKLRKELGTDVHVHAPDASPAHGFDGHMYMQHLGSASLGTVLLTTNEINSTQEFMRARQHALPPGTVLTAERQTSGRGRGGNQWTSPAGCLMFTASRALTIQGEQAPFVNYVVCLGVLQGIKDAVAETCPTAPTLPIRIKWPNDIYYLPPGMTFSGSTPVASNQGSNDTAHKHLPLKIGGALIHTTWSGRGFNLLVGVGLNVSNRQPTTCIQTLLEDALASEASGQTTAGAVPQVKPEVLLAHVITRLDECFQVFEQQGFKGSRLESEYLASWMHTGQCVMFQRHAEQSVDAVPGASGTGSIASSTGESQQVVTDSGTGDLVALQIQGINASGFLLAVDEETGRQYELTPDGNSLDMMAGLIRKKVGIV